MALLLIFYTLMMVGYLMSRHSEICIESDAEMYDLLITRCMGANSEQFAEWSEAINAYFLYWTRGAIDD